jgi:hypothetical protein
MRDSLHRLSPLKCPKSDVQKVSIAVNKTAPFHSPAPMPVAGSKLNQKCGVDNRGLYRILPVLHLNCAIYLYSNQWVDCVLSVAA